MLACLAGVLAMAGCASTPRTTIDPARTEAGEVVQRPGAVERLVVTITPPGPVIRGQGVEVPMPVPDAPRRKAPKPQAEPREHTPSGGLDETLRAAVEAARESGSTVTIDWSRQVDASADTRTLEDRGPGLDSRGENQDTDLNQRDRRLPMPWGGRDASGGGWGLTSSIVGGGGINVLHALGGLTVLAALVPIVLPPRRLGLAAAIAGTGLLLIAAGTVAAEYPWVYAIALVAFLGVLGWLAYDAWRSARKSIALREVAAGIEEQDELSPGATAKPLIRQRATKNGTLDLVKAEVAKAKKKLRRA